MMSVAKPKLLICYDHFYPAYKAGGPIQSLTNLVLSLLDEYEISVVTSGYDLNERGLLPGIKTDCWSEITLPLASKSIKVWYAGRSKPGIKAMKQIIDESGSSFIYLNGMFSYRFVIIPLLAVKNVKVVICPRGMLQKGALAGKPVKKKIYLAGLKISGFFTNVLWHATNDAEAQDIRNVFGEKVQVAVAENIPKPPLNNISPCTKSAGELRLVYLSLISAKKNLLQLINIVAKSTSNVRLDIFGPVKDEAYWQKCRDAIGSHQSIKYKGDVFPPEVQQTFGKYDASILLTKGENFGHALYESLSAGRPVITSFFTPWQQLEEKAAGWNVDISGEANILALFDKLAEMDQQTFDHYCSGAYQLAQEYYNRTDINVYKKIFS